MTLLDVLKQFFSGVASSDMSEGYRRETSDGYIPIIGRFICPKLESIEVAISNKKGQELKEGLKESISCIEGILDVLRSTIPEAGFHRAHYNLLKSMDTFKQWLTYWLDEDTINMEKYKLKLSDEIDKVNRDYKGKIHIYISIIKQ